MTKPGRAYSLAGKRVWVAGHRGLVGSALVQRLAAENCELLAVERDRLDLRRQADVEDWLGEARPEAVFLAAATVGGIQANDNRPADFLYDNMLIEANIIHASQRVGVEKLLFLGSTCIYPKFAPQPMAEADLLTGPLEPTNQWYALAKIAGVYLCQAYRRQHGCDFISAMPTNLYGPGDLFEAENSHVIPALMGKIHRAVTENAPTVEIWGSGEPYREFLYSEDAADALVYLMQTYSGESHVNVGTGEELKIIDLARLIADIAGYRGAWKFDRGRQDGTPRKLSDIRLLKALGWSPDTALRDGLQVTYDWFLDALAAGRIRA
jgi:GDP-L-fucose synthase